MNVNTPTEPVRAWLENLPAEKKPIVETLRRLIESVAPECAGYLGHLFVELDVFRFIERAFLSKHTLGTYNYSGSESIVVLSTLMKERFSWRFVWSSPSS